MDKEFLKKCWKNPRWHSLMVLIIWIVSLGVLMGIVSIMNQLRPQEKKEPIKIEENITSYEDKLQTLLSDEYLMTFLVTKKDGTLKYEGTEHNGVVNGYKEDANGIKKYRIENGIFYEVILDQINEIENIYEEILPELIDRRVIVTLLLENKKERNNKESFIYEYNLLFKEENVKIEVVETKKSIEKITIESENTEYQLTFNENKN